LPPFSSTGGDLVDQLREWFDRQRERFAGRGSGGQPQGAPRRAGRRPAAGTGRVQAVPLGTARPPGTGRPGRGRNDRAGRGTFTIVLGAVLIVGVIALFFAVRWAMQPSSSGPAVNATPGAGASPQPGLSLTPSPPPFLVPSPSPSPTPQPPPQQRIHVVEGGDTLNRIAQRYSVSVDAIMQANAFTDRNRILRIGERLVIPDGASGSSVPGVLPPPPPPAQPPR
jgi:LysM repeat protein